MWPGLDNLGCAHICVNSLLVGQLGLASLEQLHWLFGSLLTVGLGKKGDLTMCLSAPNLLGWAFLHGSQQRSKGETVSVQGLLGLSSKLAQGPFCHILLAQSPGYPKFMGWWNRLYLLMGEAVKEHYKSCWDKNSWDLRAIFAISSPQFHFLSSALESFLACFSSGPTYCKLLKGRDAYVICLHIPHFLSTEWTQLLSPPFIKCWIYSSLLIIFQYITSS